MNFQRYKDTLLYNEEIPSDPAPGFLAYLLCGSPSDPPARISANQAWQTYVGYYLFLREAPQDLDAFAAAIEQALEPTDPAHTGFAWVNYANQDQKILTMDLLATVEQSGGVVVERDTTIWFANYGLPFKQSTPIVTQEDQDGLTGFVFEYPAIPGSPPPALAHNLRLPLITAERGSFMGEVTLGDFTDDYQAGWNVGCRYFVQTDAGIASQYYPIFELEKDQQVLFQMRWDPVDQLNAARTYLAFSGVSFKLVEEASQPGTFYITAAELGNVLRSYFRTTFGEPVGLAPITTSAAPAKLVFAALPAIAEDAEAQYYLTPSGDFEVVTLGEKANPEPIYDLLCGLAGTESIGYRSRTSLAPGDTLSFHAGQPAYAPRFPLPPVNLREPNSPPVDEILLDDLFTTAWVTVTPGAGGQSSERAAANVYYSQPHGAALYANEGQAGAEGLQTLSFYQTKMADLGGNTAAASFPLAAYAGVGSISLTGEDAAGTLKQFETQIISPTRKQRILAMKREAGFFKQPAALPADVGTTLTTTPQGLLATIAIDQAARWQSLLLAHNVVNETTYDLKFSDIDTVLQDAFQTNQQFLVVTQPKIPWNEAGGTIFENLMMIEDWPFRLLVGRGNTLGDYRNVLIFKFVSGKLSEHVKNPSNWTSADQFNDVEGQGLAFLSQWLQDYIDQARVMAADERRQGMRESYFQNFLDIVDSDTWNGILALKVHIDLVQFPAQLKGLIGGIDLTRFDAHHFGVEVNFVQAQGGSLGISGNSSLFGLIYYMDAAYENQLALGGSPDRPVQAEPGDYDFKVLTLKVLFENTAVKTFESKIQVTLNRWFGDQVLNIVEPDGTPISLPSNSIILDGAYEEQDGQSTFTFSSNAESLFRLNSNVLGVVEAIFAQFSTLTDQGGAAGDLVQSRFTFTGFMNFMPVERFDLFSFGSDWIDGQPGARQGLYFSNLYLTMDFPEPTPTDRVFTFDPNFIAFNLEQSRARPGSLFPNFPLKVGGLTSGAADKGPSKLGFQSVSVDAPFTGLKGAWNGLQLQLDLGTVGALAENVGMVGLLLGAWSPSSGGTKGTYDVFLGLRLPGTGGGEARLLSLQGILSLGYSDIEFLLGETQDGRPAYMLKLTQIGLKLLGIKFPLSGNTVFYLFGDPNPGAPQNSLGWYASYNKDNQQTPPPAAVSPPAGDVSISQDQEVR
jgi:hypothetical protein